MTIRQALQETRLALKDIAGESAGLQAEQLLCAACSFERVDLYTRGEEELPPAAQQRLAGALSRRLRGEPLQYIVGSAGFMDLTIKVDSRALIPRPETERLAELAASASIPERGRILDLCCGTGCLAAYLSEVFPKSEILASDISEDALSLAAENCPKSVRLLCSDLFEKIPGVFDLIVCNPPYVPEGEIDGLQREVKDYEPRLALSGGPDGLDLIRRIIKEAPHRLAPGGFLFMEIGSDQGEAVKCLAEEAGLGKAAVCQDLNRQDRVLIARAPAPLPGAFSGDTMGRV